MRLLQPAADAVVRSAAPRRIDPLWLVVLHGLFGLAAAGAIAASSPGPGGAAPFGWWVAAALLLAKAILDNADGGLARATGRVTRMGRYFDSGVDLIVNAAVFVALGRHVGAGLAIAGWAASTLVLSLDFNMERLYRAQRAPAVAPASEPPMGAPEALYRVFEGLYRVLLAPQDRWIERLDRALFRVAEGSPYARAPEAHRLAWSDLFSTAALVDLGLSTQTVALAIALVAGRPGGFVAALGLGLVWALGVQLRRIARYRAYRHKYEETAA
jgi:phosphatidylglycerophosphate synthase